MSYLQRKSGYTYGVQCFLEKHGYDVSGNGHKQNKVMVEFLKEKNLPYKKWNWKYKGLNTADLINAEVIQENWEEFGEWVLQSIKLKT